MQANRVWVRAYHLSAPGQRQLSLLLRLSGRVHQTGRRLASAGQYARSPGHHRLATGN
jgi:hypothetical protein